MKTYVRRTTPGAATLVLVHGSGTKKAGSATVFPAFIGENAPTLRPRCASSSQICLAPACPPAFGADPGLLARRVRPATVLRAE